MEETATLSVITGMHVEQRTRSTLYSAMHVERGPHTSRRSTWGSRRCQQKIFGKGDSGEITAGRQKRLHLEKQYVLLYVTSYAERDVTVLDSKTSGIVREGYCHKIGWLSQTLYKSLLELCKW